MEENIMSTAGLEYGSDTIRTLDWKEHIRRRPGMYIGKLGDGTHACLLYTSDAADDS